MLYLSEMKRLLTILILIFTLQTPSQADDIRDFQIEGMSVGDSLLDYFSEEKIKEGIRYDYYKSDKFVKVEFWRVNLENYDVFSAHIKSNDSRYITYEISGATLYDENIKNCYPKKKEIQYEISSIFPNAEHNDSGRQTHPTDTKSTYDRFDFNLSSGGSVDITCYDWSEESGNRDHLSIGINSEEFSKWLINESNK